MLLDFVSSSIIEDLQWYLLILWAEFIELGIQLLYVIVALLYCQYSRSEAFEMSK